MFIVISPVFFEGLITSFTSKTMIKSNMYGPKVCLLQQPVGEVPTFRSVSKMERSTASKCAVEVALKAVIEFELNELVNI